MWKHSKTSKTCSCDIQTQIQSKPNEMRCYQCHGCGKILQNLAAQKESIEKLGCSFCSKTKWSSTTLASEPGERVKIGFMSLRCLLRRKTHFVHLSFFFFLPLLLSSFPPAAIHRADVMWVVGLSHVVRLWDHVAMEDDIQKKHWTVTTSAFRPRPTTLDSRTRTWNPQFKMSQAHARCKNDKQDEHDSSEGTSNWSNSSKNSVREELSWCWAVTLSTRSTASMASNSQLKPAGSVTATARRQREHPITEHHRCLEISSSRIFVSQTAFFFSFLSRRRLRLRLTELFRFLSWRRRGTFFLSWATRTGLS